MPMTPIGMNAYCACPAMSKGPHRGDARDQENRRAARRARRRSARSRADRRSARRSAGPQARPGLRTGSATTYGQRNSSALQHLQRKLSLEAQRGRRATARATAPRRSMTTCVDLEHKATHWTHDSPPKRTGEQRQQLSSHRARRFRPPVACPVRSGSSRWAGRARARRDARPTRAAAHPAAVRRPAAGASASRPAAPRCLCARGPGGCPLAVAPKLRGIDREAGQPAVGAAVRRLGHEARCPGGRRARRGRRRCSPGAASTRSSRTRSCPRPTAASRLLSR